MIVRNVNSGPKAERTLNGTQLTIKVPGVEALYVELQERQEKVQRVLDISLDRNYERLVEGVGSWYVATVVIPAIATEIYDTGAVDDEGQPIMDERTLPIDVSKVELHLWCLPGAIFEVPQEGEDQ